jgi:hypothetical protein
MTPFEREREARIAAKRACPFPHWLAAQQRRDDYIGHLARAVACDGKLPRRATVRESWRHFNCSGIDHDTITAVMDAINEWRRFITNMVKATRLCAASPPARQRNRP